ncbi:MAG: hypothetical protein QXD43_05390 [Candidatus Aenigmatarchaeota archaeon]
MNPGEFIKSYCELGLQKCFQGIYNFLVAIAVFVAFIYFIYGAILYMTSPIMDRKSDGKDKMFGALKGLFVIFISGAILYWINPNIFNAELLIYRVSGLEVPTSEYGIIGKEKFIGPSGYIYLQTEIAPPLRLGVTEYVTSVRLTRYFVPKENEEKGAFINSTKIQGSGYCFDGNWCNCDVCKKNKNKYINYLLTPIEYPKDACGFKVFSNCYNFKNCCKDKDGNCPQCYSYKYACTFAVPPEWHPSILWVYDSKGNPLYFGYGTDRGSAITGRHIDLFVGEGKGAFANYGKIDSVNIKIKKLGGCNDFKQ